MKESICGYTFEDPELLAEALTRRSWVEEGGKGSHNERLEFLGDAVLELLVTELLVVMRPECDEGELSQMRSALVREDSLAAYGVQFALGPRLRMGKGEAKLGGRDHPAILADAFEAVIAAIFKDGGIEAAREIMREPLTERIARMPKGGWRDAKSQLQELSVQHWKRLPQYTLIAKGGEAHNTSFHFSVAVGPEGEVAVVAEGVGRSRQIAQRAAASEALRLLESKGIS